MKNLLLFFLAGLSSFVSAQQNEAEAFLRRVHRQFYQGPCKVYSFSQKNFHYRNDSVVNQSTWHEAIEFPDRFIIYFGEPEKKNGILFRNDSAYSLREGQVTKARSDSNSLLLILGGMFYRDFNEVLSRLKGAGYNTSVLSQQLWKGTEHWVLGAAPGDLTSNQIWWEAKSLKVVRIIENSSASNRIDMRFEDYQNWCKGHVETKVAFYRNGKLEQVEQYYDLKQLDKFPDF